jgi:hypothetical protein
VVSVDTTYNIVDAIQSRIFTVTPVIAPGRDERLKGVSGDAALARLRTCAPGVRSRMRLGHRSSR